MSAAKLHAAGVDSVADVAGLPLEGLVDLLGRGAGRHVHALAHNRDPRAVRTGVRRRSIGAQRALGRRGSALEPAQLRAELTALVERVARRLRAARRACRTVVLRLRFADYARATRSHTIAEATSRTETLVRIAHGLLAASAELRARRGVTLIGVALTNLCDARAVQLSLPFDRAGGLDEAVDALRDRFGTGAIRRGVHVGRPADEGFPLPPGA